MQRVQVQLISGVNRQNFLQRRGGIRLPRRIEIDARDGSTLELGARRLRRRDSGGGEQHNHEHRQTHVSQ